MDILPSGNIFRELQVVHDTGYLSAQTSLEDHWEQVNYPFSLSSVSNFVDGIYLGWLLGCWAVCVTRHELQLPHYNGSVGRVDLLTLHVGAPYCVCCCGVELK
jgi:krueppel-like factor 6/7